MSLLRRAAKAFANQDFYKSRNAFIRPCDEDIVVQQLTGILRNADKRRDEGQEKSAIDGCLIALKDNVCTSDGPTTCASAILKGFHSPYPATVVEKLEEAGALIAGKTNLDEFGMGSDSLNSIYGAVQNFYTQDGDTLSAGGSSGGSAVSVATGQCDAALGTDTGGSVRLPAAYTGSTGLKPSYGIVSRWGVVAYANSLDTVGILAKDSSMVGRVFDTIKGYDSRDPTSIPVSTRSSIAQLLVERKAKRGWDGGGPSVRIGVPIEYNTAELQPEVRRAWVNTLLGLRNNGHTIHMLSLPATKIALSAYYVIASAEASSNLAKYDGVRYGNKSSASERADNVLFASTRGSGLGEEAKRRILLGSYSLSAAAIDNYFRKAQKVRRLVQRDFNNIFALDHPLLKRQGETRNEPKVDVILTPTAQSLPPKLGSLKDRASIDSYSADFLTVPASLAGVPAMSLPVPVPGQHGSDQSAQTLVGVQVIAQYGDEEMVFLMAQFIESLRAKV
ncbi:amidase signature domain-containing protein [Usnea florida]